MYKIITSTDLKKSTKHLQDLQRVTSTLLTSINTSIVDFFPWLAKLPVFLQFWRPHWESIGQSHYETFKNWLSEIKRDTSGDPSCFVQNTMLEGYTGSEDQAMYITLLAMAAGSDNPRMALNTLLMASLAYPACIQRARDEIDAIFSTERLPMLGDMPNLPYTCAVVKEVLRWRPVVPLVPQRVLTTDLDFEGYMFPTGTEFLVNSISVCSWVYEEPDKFVPERWLTRKNGIKQDLWQYAFIGGKRSCVGYKLAQQELFLVISRLLFRFDFAPTDGFDDTKLNAFVIVKFIAEKLDFKNEKQANAVV
ncbi:hypothetical protein S40293_01192 [Stachybotrys chartarum IBT 40293]|nr:hypothetical protein S40293_01192 [Stachybotrys chartarum IBT 40293]